MLTPELNICYDRPLRTSIDTLNEEKASEAISKFGVSTFSKKLINVCDSKSILRDRITGS